MKRTLPILLFALAGCGDTLIISGAAEQARSAPVLGHIQSAREKVTIYAGPAGPRFTIRDPQGRALAEGLSLDELRARHPALFQRYEKSYALDASLQTPAPEQQPYR